jgi:hypothetical protein
VAYFSEKACRQKLFTFRKAPWGPFSEDLAQVLEQLLSMGLVAAEPLDQEQGNRYALASDLSRSFSYGNWLAAISADDKRAIDKAVEQYGYLKQDALIAAGHREKAFQAKQYYDVMLEANPPDLVIAEMAPEDCDDLVLSLSPSFVDRLHQLAAAARDFDFAKVRVG